MTEYPNYRLILPYSAPYFAYVGIASLLSGIPAEWNYLLRIIVVSSLIIWAWRWYIPLVGPKRQSVSIIYGIVFGIGGTILWIILLMPFIDQTSKPWGGVSFSTRLFASTLLVPILEELLMRVLIFRLAFQWFNERKQNDNALEEVLHNQSINWVRPGEWNYFAVFFSTLAFTVGHQIVEWPAAIIYGILMASLWIIRKDIISCIVAHGTTNLALGVYVYRTQSWGLW